MPDLDSTAMSAVAQIEALRAKANGQTANGTATGTAPTGRAMSYAGARSDRTRRTLIRSESSANAALRATTHRTLRERCHELYRDNSAARAMTETMVALVIGTDTAIRPASGDPTYDAAAAEWLTDWADTPRCDVAGESTLWDLLRQVVRSHMIDGDIGLLKVVGTRLQLIESALIKNAGREDETKIDGIELDYPGGPVSKYWIDEWHPSGTSTKHKPRSIDARHMIFSANPCGRRVGQRRGEPQMQAISHLLELIDRIHLATSLAVEMGSNTPLVIKRLPDMPSLGQRQEETMTQADRDQLTALNNQQITMEPGGIFDLVAGEEAMQIKPEHPGSTLEPWIWHLLTIACGDIGLPVELVFGRYVANFSASRAATSVAWQKTIRYRQEVIEFRVIRPLVRWALREAIIAGELPPPKAGHRFDRLEVSHQRMPSLDRLAEIKASQLAIQAGLSTYHYELLAQGIYDFPVFVAIRKEENETLAAAGLAPVATPGAKPIAGPASPAPSATRAPKAKAPVDSTKADSTKADPTKADPAKTDSAKPDTTKPAASTTPLLVGDKNITVDVLGRVASGAVPGESAIELLTSVVGLSPDTASSIITPAMGFTAQGRPAPTS